MSPEIPSQNNSPRNKSTECSSLHSLTDDTPFSRSVFEGQIRECYGRVVYTHKTHEKCADILLDAWARIKFWQIVFSALAAGGFIAAAFDVGKWSAILGALVSTTLFGLNAYTKNYDHGQLAQKHKQTGAALWMIRERYLNLIVDIVMGERPIEALQKERDAITSDLGKIYESAPATTSKAYAKAQEALKTREDLTFADGEIDLLLPKSLRSNRPQRIGAADQTFPLEPSK
jgi:hypothetical protein